MKTSLKADNSVQGGDVTGTKKIDVSQGRALDVAEASFNPGYDLSSTFDAGYVDESCLVQGYCDYGVCVGEQSPVGGKKIG